MTIPEQLKQLMAYVLQHDAAMRERFFRHVGCLPEELFDFDGEPFIQCEWKH